MNLQSLIGGEFRVSIDSRSSKRDIGRPSKIRSESSFHVGKRGEVINFALRQDVVPVALVDIDSHVWLLTAGGSGLVMFESADANPIDERQSAAVTAVVAALELLFEVDSVPKPKKPRAKKPAEPELAEVVAEIESELNVEEDEHDDLD
jgi:hypothetical protein